MVLIYEEGFLRSVDFAVTFQLFSVLLFIYLLQLLLYVLIVLVNVSPVIGCRWKNRVLLIAPVVAVVGISCEMVEFSIIGDALRDQVNWVLSEGGATRSRSEGSGIY